MRPKHPLASDAMDRNKPSPELQKIMVNIARIVSGLNQKNDDAVEVAKYCKELGELAANDADSVKWIVTMNGVEAVTRAWKKHAQDAVVSEKAIYALWKMTEADERSRGGDACMKKAP